MGEEKTRWLWRECCDTIMPVNKTYGKIEIFKCECGRSVDGKYLTYYDTKEAATKARHEKKGYGLPGMEGLDEGDLDSMLGQQGGL